MKLAACLIVVLAAALPASADPGEILAKVNGEPVVRAELDRLVEGELAQLDARGLRLPQDQLMPLRNRELRHLIDNVLLAQAGKAAGIQIDEREIEAELASFRGPAGSEEAFQERLKELGLALEDLQRALARDLFAAKYLDERLKDAPGPSEEEIRAYYAAHGPAFRQEEAIRVRHILVAAGEPAGTAEHEAARTRAEELRRRALEGEEFAALASAHSACPSAREGGDLGFFTRGQMAPEFEAAAWKLEDGAISPVLKTRFGYHVIRMVAKRPAREISLTEAAPGIQGQLAQEKYRTGTAAVLAELRARASVVDGAGQPVPGYGPGAAAGKAAPDAPEPTGREPR